MDDRFNRVAWLSPGWESLGLHVATTLRCGGLSTSPFASLNLGLHVGDEPSRVRANRRRVQDTLGVPGEPLWLDQVHGTGVAIAERATGVPTADAAITCKPERVLAVLTADCLPVVIADPATRCLAVAHAGWRGLAAGVIEATVRALRADAATPTTDDAALLAWLGPAIGPDAFTVGDEVRGAFVADDVRASDCFRPNDQGHLRGPWLADLYALARLRLARCGIHQVSGGSPWCTYGDPKRFFSHRRDTTTGRHATLAWQDAAAAPAR